MGHDIFITWRNMRPKGAEDEIDIIDSDYLILVIADILLELPLPLHTTSHYVIMTIIVVVAWNNKYLAIVCRCPFPELAQWGHIVSQIEDVTGQNQHITRNRKLIMFQIPAVLCELHMQVTHVLYLHCYFSLLCSTCLSMILFTCPNDTGVKLLLSTPTSYCVG